MLTFLGRRLLLSVLVLLAISLASWALFATYLNPLWVFFADPHSKQALATAANAHVHDPLLVRYWRWLSGIFTGGGLGRTVVGDEPVWPVIGPALARTAELAAFALVISTVVSTMVAGVSARRRDSPLDLGIRTASYVAAATPGFLMAALLLQAGVSVSHAWRGYPLAIAGPPSGGLVAWFSHMTLPAIVIALGFVGIYSRYLRSAIVNELGATYVTVARAKGLGERRIVRRHVLRNAFVPFATAIASDFGVVLTMTLAVDYVFGLRGLASILFFGGLDNGDPYMVQGTIVTAALFVLVGSFLGDAVTALLDPRVRVA